MTIHFVSQEAFDEMKARAERAEALVGRASAGFIAANVVADNRAERAEAQLAEARVENARVLDEARAISRHDATKHAEIAAERDTAQAQLAVLRGAADPLLSYLGAMLTSIGNYHPTGDEAHTIARLAKPVRAALADTAAAAEAHDRKVAAKALRDAADVSDRDAARWGTESHSAAWLRARADEIEGGR